LSESRYVIRALPRGGASEMSLPLPEPMAAELMKMLRQEALRPIYFKVSQSETAYLDPAGFAYIHITQRDASEAPVKWI